jgi:GntR family transcriptional regulator, phosphonate transport system regulatory protein
MVLEMTRRAANAEKRTEAKPATGGVALWRRIADALEQSIAQGSFKAGTKLPAETEIAERFGVNRHTVRRAIAALTERGLVRAERGSGTYVEAARIAYPIRRRTRFSEIVEGAGHAVGGRLVASHIEKADGEIAKRLKIKSGTPVIRMERVRQADGVPIVASTTWLPADRFPNAARVYVMSSNSITRMLANFGVRDYTRQSTRVTAAIAEAADAESLKLALGRPLLVVESVDADADGLPVLTTRSRFASDRVALVLET